ARTWQKWLSRRGHGHRLHWRRFTTLLKRHPLPAPRIVHRYTTMSEVAIGLFVATAGFAIGLDGDLFRRAAAGLIAFAGMTTAAAGAPPMPGVACAKSTGDDADRDTPSAKVRAGAGDP